MAKLRLPFSLDNPDELTPAVYADAVYDENLQLSQEDINSQIISLSTTVNTKLDYIIQLLEEMLANSNDKPVIDPEDDETIVFSNYSLDPEEGESLLIS